MKKYIKFMMIIFLYAIICCTFMLAYAQTDIKYIDAESNIEATFDVDLSGSDDEFVDIDMFSDENASDQRYGKSIIQKMNNSEALLYAYGCLEDGIANADTEIFVYDGKNPISVEEIKVVIEVYTADYPESFWFNGICSISYTAETVKRVFPSYIIDGVSADKTKIAGAKNMFDSVVDSIVEQMYKSVPEGESDYETQYGYALWLHDKVADIVEYEFGPNHQTAYGVLVDKKAVCAGYSKAYQCLLNKVGIKAWSVKGQSVNPVTGGFEAHEWNLLWLDGNCVYVDVTWDDQQQDIYHLYFARSLKEFSLDHVPFTGIYSIALPDGNDDKCQHSGYFEHTHSDNIITGEVTGEKIKSLFIELGTSGIWDAVVYDPSGEIFYNWIKAQKDLNCIVPDSFDGVGRGFIFNNMGNTTQGVEYHISIINLDTTRLYLEESSDKAECNFRMVSGMDDMEKEYNLCVAFYDDNGALVSLSIQQPPSYYQHIHMHIPEGCDSYKIMLMEGGTIKPLCESISIE